MIKNIKMIKNTLKTDSCKMNVYFIYMFYIKYDQKMSKDYSQIIITLFIKKTSD